MDKNAGMHERAKYARICVEVDLTKPLVVMFMIKDRKYNVEYEGLHLLCTLCGRFRHDYATERKWWLRFEEVRGYEQSLFYEAWLAPFK